MQHVAALARRPAMALAAAAVLVGLGLLAVSMAGMIGAQAAGVPAEDDLAGLELEEMPASQDAEAAPAEVIVYVSGAVAAPDVYRLPAEARVKDLVLAAGGLAPDADADRINLAGRLTDGQHIVVPRQGGEPATAEVLAAEDVGGGLVNINTATVAELDTLPGVGQTTAERIVEHREANGPFQSIEDLQSVRGIGPAAFGKIAPLVRVE